MELEDRLELVLALADKMVEKRDELIEAAINDIGFTFKDISVEFELTVDRLRNFRRAIKLIEDREPICREDEEVALTLPYNGSAWLNIAIASIFLVGNNVTVKFSSKGSGIAKLYENMYGKIFGEMIKFDYRHGREFMKHAIESTQVKAIVAFGSDSTVLQYENVIKKAKKKTHI
ncbi:hypothetical protein DRP05_02705 [Archaeoglobales archaeon]|nr:MAG: hypothetical protein DRP05_02705 [Archaeoglobales archaeon]